MAVPELDKFREKFPQYNDLDDVTIANKLATKYPDAYGDLPSKVGQIEQPQESALSQVVGTALSSATPPWAQMNIQGTPQVQSARQRYFQGENAIVNPIRQGLSDISLQSRIPQSIKTALSGSVPLTGAMNLPEAVSSMPLKPSEMATTVATGMALGGLAQGIPKFKPQNWLNPKNQLKVADEARNVLFKQKQNFTENLYPEVYKKVKDIQTKIPMNNAFQGLMDNTDDAINTISGQYDFNQALASKDPTATKLLNLVKSFRDNPQTLEPISVQEADALQKYIRNLPGIRNKLSQSAKKGFEQVDWNNSERIMLDFASDLKESVMDLAPELKALNQQYGQFMNNYKRIRPYLKWNNSVTNFKEINKLDPAVQDLFARTLPKSTLQKISNINRAERFKKLMSIVGGGSAAAYIAHRYLSGKILGQNQY